jgi:hypothetical protein
MRPDAANAWVYERIAAAVSEANQNYGFDLLGMMDPLQFTLYDARTRDEIGWHVDCGRDRTRRASSRSLSSYRPRRTTTAATSSS